MTGIEVKDMSDTVKTTEQRRLEKLLQALNNAVNTLLTAENEETLEVSLMKSMEPIGECLDVDRVQIWRNESFDGALHFVHQFEWLSEAGRQYGPVPIGLRLPYSAVPQWESMFIRGECINGPISELSQTEQGFLNRFNMKSIVIIPILLHEQFLGFFSIDDCRHERTLTEQELDILRSASLMMVSTMDRIAQSADINRMIKDIAQRDLLFSSVNNAITLLLQAESDEFESALWSSMGIMARAVDADRMRLWKNYIEKGKLHCTQLYEWSEGAEPQQGADITLNVLYETDLPGWEEKLSGGQCINNITRNMSQKEQERFLPQDILSILIVPVFLRDEFWGFVGFNDCHQERLFTANEESILRSASLLIATVLLRNEMTQELATALEVSQAASKSKSNFLSNMSHEIRTPINAIVGMTMIGKTAADTEKKNYAFEKIEVASSHLLGVINDVLDMSKIEANKFELSNVEFDFERMLQKVVNVIVFRVNEKGQKLTVNLDPKIPQRLVGDDQRLAQVIANLLSNAVKFTPEAGAITVQLYLIGEEDGLCTLQIDVKDTGIGISREQQERLFASFEQAESSTSRRFGGTGLGLAISKQIVELMNGEIWVNSEFGEGATFSFTAKLGRASAGNGAPIHVAARNVRILVVDDDTETLEFFRAFALRMGIECDATASGSEALEMFRQNHRYDICFLDWAMPEMSGIELSREIRSISANRPAIVMISSYDWISIEQDAKEAGVDGFLSKPLFSSEVMDCINSYIGVKNISKTKDSADEPVESFKGFRILLAEDMEINQEIVQALLEPTQIEIDCVSNGMEAVRAFSDSPERYDIIFMDIQMPEMDGLTAAQRIRELDIARAREIPIVAMTANVFREDVEQCMEAGMNDHIGKPIDIDDMLSKLKEYLKRSETTGETRVGSRE